MTHRYYDLITASVEIDDSGLQSKLDELESFDPSDLEERLSALEALNTCNVDINDLGGLPDRVEALETSALVTDENKDVIDALDQHVISLGQRVGELERNLGEWRATDLAALGERIERLEAQTNLSYNFFALAGKMVSLLLNGSRS